MKVQLPKAAPTMADAAGDAVVPHDNDVLFGRGFTISKHAGNRHLRSVVMSNKAAFLKAKKKEKREMAKRIVEEIQNLDPPGRFLIEDPKSDDGGDSDEKDGILGKMWTLVETEKAVDKVMHRLRERDKIYAEVSSQMQQEQQAHADVSRQPRQEQLANSGIPSLLAAGFRKEQLANSAGPSFPAAGLGTALPPNQLAYVLQNMQQAGGGVGNALSNGLTLAHILQNMQQAGGGDNFLGQALADQAPQQICMPQQRKNNEPPSNRSLGQLVQQLNNQQSALQQLLQQHSMQQIQFGTQSNIGNALNSLSAGTQVPNAPQSSIRHVGTLSNVGNALNSQSADSPAQNAQQSSIQQAGTRSNVGNALVRPPSAPSLSLAGANANASLSIAHMDPQRHSAETGHARTDAGPTLDNGARLSTLTASPLYRAVPVDELVNLGPQALNAQQSSIQQGRTQSNIGNALNSQSADPPAPNERQSSLQQVGTQSSVGNAMVCSPSAASQANSLLLDVANQRSGNQSSFTTTADAQVIQTRHTRTDMGQTLDNSARSSALTTSPLNQAVRADKQARSLNDLARNAGFSGEAPTIEQKAVESAGKTLTVDKKTQKSQQQFRVVTLREWIDASIPRASETTTPGHLTAEMSSYIKLAIPIALKLTEYLIETDNLTGAGATASLGCEDVLVWLKQSFDVPRNQTVESVDRVEVKGGVGDDRDPGANLPCLYSLGLILHEVFSSQSGKDAANAVAGSLVSVKGLSLDNEAMAFDRPTKRSQPNYSLPRDNAIHDGFLAALELRGIPRSLRALVGNLLDCVHGDLRGDEAYRSLSDVRTDLRLMRDDPARFLDDIPGGTTSFGVGSKFYGREGDITSIGTSYQRHLGGGCGGIIVRGGAGVGKSVLVSEVTRTLAAQTDACFLEAKFKQNEGALPLSTIGAAFNSLCDIFARDATRSQLDAVAATLHDSLGDQTALLVGVLPSLTKLITCSGGGASNMCIDPAASMQFLFKKLLETLSEHRRVLLFLDDLQFADPSSLLLISSMLSNTKESSRVFFASCYRDDDVREGSPFAGWLSSINTFPLATMELQNIGIGAVNELVSESLHLSPRITRPLASTLHQKTRGNPLFLRQLLDSLRDQGHIYFNLSSRRWSWDIDHIMNLEISDSVVALLIKEMQRQHPDFQLGLEVAACMGSCVKYYVFDILLQDLDLDLRDFLNLAIQKGFMVRADETMVRFVHDKVEQAAYEMLPVQQRLENHMRFGLALVTHALDAGTDNDELFFVAVHQINCAGPDVLPTTKQRDMVAELNLKAGKRSIKLSDHSTALTLFEHGIAFLDDGNCWAAHYNLSLELFEAAVETACTLNDAMTVRRLSEQVLANAKCEDDKLKCLYSVVKSLRLAYKFQDSKRVAFTMLEQLGESLPRSMNDVGLVANIQDMKLILLSMSDEFILNMKESNQNKRDTLRLNLYHDLNHLYQFIDPTLIADTSLRMAQITLSNGLCSMSPLAYAHYAIVHVTIKDTELGYRLGTLALRLLEKVNAQRYTSAVIALVGTLVSWVAEPLQSITDSHLLGYNYGQRNGDVVSSSLNYQFYLQTSYLSGQNLSNARANSKKFAHELLERKQEYMYNGACSIYLQTVAFIEGLGFEEEEKGAAKLLSWNDIMAKAIAASHAEFSLIFSSHLYMRSLLFKQYVQLPREGLLDHILEKNVPLRPIFYYGIFFEGLVSIQLARQTDGAEHRRKGEGALVFMRNWSKLNKWNFENKQLLLEAEMMNLSGYHDRASQLYEASIGSAKEHKFVHEEAIASELAATFFYERGLIQKSHSFFTHSASCYKKWGALAIAKRVENDILGKFGSGFVQHEPIDDSLASILAPKASSKKR